MIGGSWCGGVLCCLNRLISRVLVQADRLLHPDMPALCRLKELVLLHMDLALFPAPRADALQSLTCLNLGDNCFTRLPSDVSRITTLRALHLYSNSGLQLEHKDVGTLAVLPSLKALDLRKAPLASEFPCAGGSWSQLSVDVLLAIRQ